MQTANDWQQMEARQRDFEQARIRNVQTFAQMFLSLGPDVIKIARHGSRPGVGRGQGASCAPMGSVAGEQQIERDQQNLASRPRKRPTQPGDDMLADEVIKRLETQFAAEVDVMRVGLEELQVEAKRERKEIESFIAKRR